MISQNQFNPNYLGKTESIMCLGNGYMGTRSAEEEMYNHTTRNTFVAGTFNTFDENEVTELPNVPDMWQIEVYVNGDRFHLNKGVVESYKKTLNLKNGELTRHFIWKHKGYHLSFQFRRFVSKENRHLMASQVKIENLTDQTLKLEVRSGIDGQVTNSGSQHFTDGDKGLVDGKYIQMMPQTTHSKIDFVLSMAHYFSAKDMIQRPETGRRSFYGIYKFELVGNSTETIEKRANIFTSIDNDLANHSIKAMRDIAIENLEYFEQFTFDQLLEQSAQSWQEIWDKHPITIESMNPKDQLAVRFAQYHLHVMTPGHDERMNIGAKGLSGEGYKGHTFWDTEIFMLPYFTFTHPKIARRLVTYRYLGLEGAHKKASSNDYDGAQYPWEAAWPDDGEVTPVWGAADIVTGQPTKIWSGFIEQHITSDVAIGIKQYLDVTGDEKFARRRGYEILIDTAKFWASRLDYNEDKDIYEINGVIGPDEYKEHINNNAYTNYTAHWNIEYAIKLIDYLAEQKPEIYKKLDKKFDLRPLQEKLAEKLPKLFLPEPNSEGIIPQDDSYLSKRILDLSKYRTTDGVDGLFHDYNLDQVNQMQITKQADVLLLVLLFEDLFDKDLKLKNFDYYEPKTTHDSSLSLSTHAILSADLGKVDQSYEFFQKAISIDMGEYMKSSDAGIHAASLGGIWQMTVYGYGGVRMIDGKLRIEPHLPDEWSSLSFGIDYQEQALSIKVTKNDFTISKVENGEPVTFIHKGEEVTLVNTLTISI